MTEPFDDDERWLDGSLKAAVPTRSMLPGRGIAVVPGPANWRRRALTAMAAPLGVAALADPGRDTRGRRLA